MSQNTVSSESIEFAVFPLPDVVVFPGQTISLHIFEPRYRKMIQDCLQNHRLVGLALPKRVLTPKREKDFSPAEMLHRNQLTFEPYPIMGVGPVRLNETTTDGRLYVEVNINSVAQVRQMVQDVPYYLADGVFLQEKEVSPDTSKKWIEKLQGVYTRVLQNEPKYYSLLKDAMANLDLGLAEWTYLIFRWCKMDPGFMQMVLEVRDPLLRAQILTEVLSPNVEAPQPNEKGTILPFPDPL